MSWVKFVIIVLVSFLLTVMLTGCACSDYGIECPRFGAYAG